MFNFRFNPEKKRVESVVNPQISEKELKIPGDDYREKNPHPKSQDPLYTKTENKWGIFREGSNHINTKDMSSIDYLENSKDLEHKDSSYTFKTREDVADESDPYSDFEGEYINKSWLPKIENPENVNDLSGEIESVEEFDPADVAQKQRV